MGEGKEVSRPDSANPWSLRRVPAWVGIAAVLLVLAMIFVFPGALLIRTFTTNFGWCKRCHPDKYREWTGSRLHTTRNTSCADCHAEPVAFFSAEGAFWGKRIRSWLKGEHYSADSGVVNSNCEFCHNVLNDDEFGRPNIRAADNLLVAKEEMSHREKIVGPAIIESQRAGDPRVQNPGWQLPKELRALWWRVTGHLPSYATGRRLMVVRMDHKLHLGEGLGCSDCHSNIVHERRRSGTNRPYKAVCYPCHRREIDGLASSSSCTVCHYVLLTY